MRHRVVISRPLPGEPVERLRAAHGLDLDIWINPADERLQRGTLLDVVRGAHAILVTPADMNVNSELFDAAGRQLVMVSAYAVGVDNIDVAEAKRRGILVGHTPGAVTEPTADIAWLLILAAMRRGREGVDLVRSGAWTGVRPFDPMGYRLAGKTLHIVGAGRIGLATARRSIGWPMRVLYTARSRHEEFEQSPISAQRVELEEGLRQADIVSLHTPLTPETRHLINRERLRMMKPTAVLVNTSRGAVVDETALVDALRERWIFAAGLDVFEAEPKVHPGLVELDNAFLMPHWGSATVEDRSWMTQIAVDNILAALRGEKPPHVV